MRNVLLITLCQLYFVGLVACNKDNIEIQEQQVDAEIPKWKIISGIWQLDKDIISSHSVNSKGVPRILVYNEMNTESQWENLYLEFKIEDFETVVSCGFALNTNNEDDYGFLRIRKTDSETYLQAGVWKFNKFRTSMNIQLEENIIPGEWYYLKIFPTVKRDQKPPWTIILGRKKDERIIFESPIHNQLPLFGRGITGLYAEGSKVIFKNFKVKNTHKIDQVSTLKVHPLFNNGMILQRRSLIPVWGKGLPGEVVKIFFNDVEYNSIIDKLGNWRINLPPVEATDSTGMMICSVNDTIILNNIAIGEIWLASGQSNMETQVWQSDVAEVVNENSSDEFLRFFIQPKWPSEIPLTENGGNWEKAIPENIEKWSAVAYSFALQLRKKLDVPVGIIYSAWGGTAAECWLPRDVLKNDPLTKPILDRYENNVPGHYKSPGALFNGMIYPILPFALNGIIWYQGESNSTRAKQYESLFPLLINSWRNLWQKSDLYFAYVQLSGYDGGAAGANIESAWPQLRDAQRTTMDKLNDVGMAVSIDLGHPTNIHPREKYEVGCRLARWALHDVYGFDEIVRSGPLFLSVSFSGNQANVNFTEVANGLKSKHGREIQGFTIAGEDKIFFPANAQINSDKSSIRVWSNNVLEPVAVRYAWANYPAEANLVNSDDLPASPFRTDTWSLPTDNNR
jgi:sialate O-acetylesterase